MTLLDHLLLGLLLASPKSGYDLRKILQETELAQFSASPGSVYPALRRLDRAGLIRPAAGPASDARKRTLYELSEKGRSALSTWVRERQTDDSFRRCPQEFSVKYAFCERMMSKAEIVSALEHHEKQLKRQSRRLEARIDALPDMAPHSVREVLEQGVALYRTRHRWARSVRARHTKEE